MMTWQRRLGWIVVFIVAMPIMAAGALETLMRGARRP
jgi:hypothetical protein